MVGVDIPYLVIWNFFLFSFWDSSGCLAADVGLGFFFPTDSVWDSKALGI